MSSLFVAEVSCFVGTLHHFLCFAMLLCMFLNNTHTHTHLPGKIFKAEVQHVPTARTGSSVTLSFIVTEVEAGSYDGPLTLSVLLNDTVIVSSTRLSTPGQVRTLNLEISGRGVVEYQFKADNDISSYQGKTTINVVGETM